MRRRQDRQEWPGSRQRRRQSPSPPTAARPAWSNFFRFCPELSSGFANTGLYISVSFILGSHWPPRPVVKVNLEARCFWEMSRRALSSNSCFGDWAVEYGEQKKRWRSSRQPSLMFYRRNEIVSRSTPADYCAILAHGAAIQLSKYPVSVANPLATRFCPASTETLSSGKSPASA